MNVQSFAPEHPAPAGERRGRSLAEICAEIEARVADAAVHRAPFPHLVLDGLLPEEVLSNLHGFWPDEARLRHSNSLNRSEVAVSRLAATAEGRERAFWSALRALTARIALAVRARLTPHLGIKFRPLAGPGWRRHLDADAYAPGDAMLASYGGTVELPVHVDNARLAINGFVYLSDRERPSAAPLRGTMLYRSLGLAWPTNSTLPADARRYLREDREIEWRDNRLLAYVNGPTSFHAVPRHDIGEARRRLLMFGSLLDRQTAARMLDPALL